MVQLICCVGIAREHLVVLTCPGCTGKICQSCYGHRTVVRNGVCIPCAEKGLGQRELLLQGMLPLTSGHLGRQTSAGPPHERSRTCAGKPSRTTTKIAERRPPLIQLCFTIHEVESGA